MSGLIKRAVTKARRLKLIDAAQLHALHETEHLKRIFAHLGVDLVIDVGANAGQYATRLRRDIGYAGPIVSVEPLPEMIAHLRRLSAHDPAWHLEPIVVSDRSGEVTFNVTNDRQCSSLAEPDDSETDLFVEQTTITRKIQVRSETLDELLKRWLGKGAYKRPFLKLDTQGHDTAIVRGCTSMREFAGFQSELSVKRLYKDTPTFAEAITEYCSRGFDVSALVPNNAAGFPQLIEIDCIMIRSDLVAGGRPDA